jgi:DNA-binding CsgD family transcriptional regulator
MLRTFRARVRRVESEWLTALAERSAATLLVADGDPERAAARLDRVVATLDRIGHRPDAARTQLGLGRALLKAGRRTAAADALADAYARFGALGAPIWAGRAAAELERTAPGRVAGALTTTERRVVAEVVAGRRNKEIAGAMYVSLATVEAHLTRIYRKLGIRSRSELVHLVADGTIDLTAAQGTS